MGCNPTKNKIFDSSKILTTTDLAEPHSKTMHSLPDILTTEKSADLSSANIQNLTSGLCEKISPIKTNQILFHFDTEAMLFVSFDLETKEWTTNDLTKARVFHSTRAITSSSIIQKTEEVNDILTRIKQFSQSFISPNKIALVGPKHCHYYLEHNCFVRKPSMNSRSIKRPCLAFTGRRLFAFSGEQKDKFSTNAEVFDMNSETWTSLKDTPTPHVNGAACCFFGEFNVVKVLVFGGYSHRKPPRPSHEMHLYDDVNKEWRVLELTRTVISRFQAISKPSIYVTEDGTIHIQQLSNGHKHFELKLQKRLLVKNENLNKGLDSKEFKLVQSNKNCREEIGVLLKSREPSTILKAQEEAPGYSVLLTDDKGQEWTQRFTTEKALPKKQWSFLQKK